MIQAVEALGDDLRAGRAPLPTRTTEELAFHLNVPAAGQGIDPDKKIAGRKRHIGVDTLGLLLAQQQRPDPRR